MCDIVLYRVSARQDNGETEAVCLCREQCALFIDRNEMFRVKREFKAFTGMKALQTLSCLDAVGS